MGRIEFTGPDACRFLDHLLTNDVAKLQVGQIRYALVTNENGGILDDVLVYRFADRYMLVVNASNRVKILAWIEQHRGGFNVDVNDLTLATFMLAIQGPQRAGDSEPARCRRHRRAEVLHGHRFDGDRPARHREPHGVYGRGRFRSHRARRERRRTVGNAHRPPAQPHGLLPAGLGCRDTLRLEAAMPLYGHELDETIDPFTAGLAFGVKLDAGDFLGKQALVAAKARKDRPTRVGLMLESRRIAREGALLFDGENQIGRVTSGTYSPTLEKSIAMAYIDRDHSSPRHAASKSTSAANANRQQSSSCRFIRERKIPDKTWFPNPA